MSDPKVWLDLITAIWLVAIGVLTDTANLRSALVFQIIPILLGIAIAMSQAKAIF